jgi:hypothetical protein
VTLGGVYGCAEASSNLEMQWRDLLRYSREHLKLGRGGPPSRGLEGTCLLAAGDPPTVECGCLVARVSSATTRQRSFAGVTLRPGCLVRSDQSGRPMPY